MMLLLLFLLIPVEARSSDEAERHLGRPGQVVVGVHHTSATKVIIRRASNKKRLSFGGTLVKTGQFRFRRTIKSEVLKVKMSNMGEQNVEKCHTIFRKKSRKQYSKKM